MVRLDRLKPASLNDEVYRPVALDDPGIIALANDIRQKGLHDPIVATEDDVIVAGHRRRAGCIVAGRVVVPIRRVNIRSDDPRFPEYLVSFNLQRVKTVTEQVREEAVRTSPDAAYSTLRELRLDEHDRHYERLRNANLRVIDAGPARRRARISHSKRPMLAAAVAVIDQYAAYWPLTLRQIHYRLLTRKVLRNVTHQNSLYVNSEACYKDLSDLLTRARLLGEVPWQAMHDPTRPRTRWAVWPEPGAYLREQCDRFLAGYRRDLLHSQPAFVELVVEKLAAFDIAERPAAEFCVPVGVGKGYSSVTCLDETAARFRASGKDRFTLLIAGDLDPEGENICETWAKCLRDEHDVCNLTTVKVGVNPEHVQQYNLARLPMKAGSSRAKGFAARHGRNVYELESFEPDQLQAIIQDTIRGVLDLDRFAEERRREAEDARHMVALRKHVCSLIQSCDLGDLSSERPD
jgi:hypothetical protein